MCQMCALTQSFDPSRHSGTGEATDFAQIIETTDASASTLTSYGMSDGDTFSGTLSSGDRDWVAVTMTAGSSYEINLTGSASGNGTLSDPYLRLYNSSGVLVSWDDDSGAGLESSITYTASSSGTYYIAAGSYGDYGTGTYEITFDSGYTPPPSTGGVGTLDELADYLTDGYWSETSRSGRAFDTSSSNQISVNITGLTAAGQQLARWAFEAWELVANIDFVETTGSADITFDDSDSGAYASSVTSGGEIVSSEVNVSQSWVSSYGSTISSYTFSTYIHEIGHALGLGHQGGYNGSATYGVDETFTNDSYQLSVMSYFSQTDNTTVNADYAEPASAMMADIVAIQNLYGAPGSSSQTAGNTVWGTNTTLSGYFADIADGLSGTSNSNLGSDPIAFTIYDRDGVDLINLTGNHDDNRLDMTSTGISDIAGLTGNVMIARGTVIENASMGRGDDTVIGNNANNTLRGGGGRDELEGNGGRDRLFGNAGRDELEGGAGNDRLVGGGGGDRLEGGGGRDRIEGSNGRDRLFGNAGGDRLDGGTGNDLLVGGGGSDRFIFNTGCDADRIRDFGNGNDRLVLSTNLTGGLDDAQDVIDTFASVSNGNTVLTFGNGDSVQLLGFTDLNALADDILFV